VDGSVGRASRESSKKYRMRCVEDRRGLCTIYSGLWHFSATFVVHRGEVVGKSLGKSHSYTSRIWGQKVVIWVPKSKTKLTRTLWYTLGTAHDFESKRLQSSRRFSSVSLMPACCGAWNGVWPDLVLWREEAGRQPPGSPGYLTRSRPLLRDTQHFVPSLTERSSPGRFHQ